MADMASRPYLLKENSMSFLWRNDLRLKTFLFMDYSMPSSWMEGVYYFKYRSLGIFSLLGSTVYHDSAVNCGTVPSEEAVLLAVLLLLQTLSLLKYCSFERVISFLEDSSLWETISLQFPFH